MSGRPLVPRALARSDVTEALAYYLREAGQMAALGFIGALEKTYTAISRHPAAGSPGYAQALDLPGLRSRMLARYPHIVFYVERTDHIDIWRVLHAQRDLPVTLRDPDGA